MRRGGLGETRTTIFHLELDGLPVLGSASELTRSRGRAVSLWGEALAYRSALPLPARTLTSTRTGPGLAYHPVLEEPVMVSRGHGVVSTEGLDSGRRWSHPAPVLYGDSYQIIDLPGFDCRGVNPAVKCNPANTQSRGVWAKESRDSSAGTCRYTLKDDERDARPIELEIVDAEGIAETCSASPLVSMGQSPDLSADQSHAYVWAYDVLDFLHSTSAHLVGADGQPIEPSFRDAFDINVRPSETDHCYGFAACVVREWETVVNLDILATGGQRSDISRLIFYAHELGHVPQHFSEALSQADYDPFGATFECRIAAYEGWADAFALAYALDRNDRASTDFGHLRVGGSSSVDASTSIKHRRRINAYKTAVFMGTYYPIPQLISQTDGTPTRPVLADLREGVFSYERTPCGHHSAHGCNGGGGNRYECGGIIGQIYWALAWNRFPYTTGPIRRTRRVEASTVSTGRANVGSRTAAGPASRRSGAPGPRASVALLEVSPPVRGV